MNYKCEVNINLPREAVVALFDNYEYRAHWQIGILDFETVEGVPGEVDSIVDLHCKMGNKDMIITEKILEKKLPDYVSGLYLSGGVENISTDSFMANDDHSTTYVSEQEFYTKKIFMRLFMLLMPSMFKKETLKNMNSFKKFCEGHELD